MTTEEDVLKLFEDLRPAQPDDAVRLLTEFLTARPGSLRVKFRLALAYENGYGEGPLGAVRLYREILEDDPENVACLTALALMPDTPGFHLSSEERIALLTKAVDQSGDLTAMMNLAYKAWDLGQPARALEAFSRLHVAAKERGEEPKVRVATKALADIRKGKACYQATYSIPEAWVANSRSNSGA